MCSVIQFIDPLSTIFGFLNKNELSREMSIVVSFCYKYYNSLSQSSAHNSAGWRDPAGCYW